MNLHDIIGHAEALTGAVLDGEVDALQAFADLRAAKGAIEDALKKVEDSALTEAQKYGKSFERHGLHWTVSEGRRTYKYDHLKEWNDAKEVLSSIEEKAKQAGIAATNGIGMHTSDGEVIEAAIVTYGKASLTIKAIK